LGAVVVDKADDGRARPGKWYYGLRPHELPGFILAFKVVHGPRTSSVNPLLKARSIPRVILMGERDEAGLGKAGLDGERTRLLRRQFGLGEYRID
jgi:hypothetical protein